MNVTDYNGEGRWSRVEILARYGQYAAEAKIIPLDLSPMEHEERGHRWVYPAMSKVIEGIEAGDRACIRIGIEFIEEDAKFTFGKILKSNTARALRRAVLSDSQKHRIRRRVFGLLRDGHVPHEFREYAKLVRRIGFDASEIPEVDGSDPYVERFRRYFEMACKANLATVKP